MRGQLGGYVRHAPRSELGPPAAQRRHFDAMTASKLAHTKTALLVGLDQLQPFGTGTVTGHDYLARRQCRRARA